MGDTEDLQHMIDQAVRGERDRRIQLEPRVYRMTRGIHGAWCVRIPPNDRRIEIVGHRPAEVDGVLVESPTRLVQAADMPNNVRTIHVDGEATTVSDVTLDSEPQDDANDHRAGLFIAARRFTADRVTSKGHTGDGFYVEEGGDICTLTNCWAVDNGRDGLVISGVSDLRVIDSRFVHNGAQQVDMEMARNEEASNIKIIGCVIASGSSRDYALTLGGSHPDHPGSWIDVIDTDILGPVYAVWAGDLRMTRCKVTSSGGQPGIGVWRGCNTVEIVDCSVTSALADGVAVIATSNESASIGVSIRGSRVRCQNPQAHGVVLHGAIGAEVAGCELTGAGQVGAGGWPAGVLVRAINTQYDMQHIRIHGNEISGWGRCGVTVGGNTVVGPDGVRRTAHIRHMEITENRIGLQSGCTITDGMILDDGSKVIRRLVTGENRFGEGVVRHVQRAPSNVVEWTRV